MRFVSKKQLSLISLALFILMLILSGCGESQSSADTAQSAAVEAQGKMVYYALNG